MVAACTEGSGEDDDFLTTVININQDVTKDAIERCNNITHNFKIFISLKIYPPLRQSGFSDGWYKAYSQQTYDEFLSYMNMFSINECSHPFITKTKIYKSSKVVDFNEVYFAASVIKTILEFYIVGKAIPKRMEKPDMLLKYYNKLNNLLPDNSQHNQ